MSKKELEEIADLIRDNLSNREEVVTRLSDLVSEKELQKILNLVHAYLDDPDSFKKMFGEKDIENLLNELLS